MAKRNDAFAGISSDWVRFFWLLRFLGIRLGFSNTSGGFGSGFNLV